MITYIESIEDTSGKPDNYEGEFIQEEVTGTEKQAKDKVTAKEKGEKTYKMRKHYCYHDEELNKPCTVEEI